MIDATNANSEEQNTDQLPIPNIDKNLLKKIVLEFIDAKKSFDVCKSNLDGIIVKTTTVISNYIESFKTMDGWTIIKTSDCKKIFETIHGLAFKEINNKLTAYSDAFAADTAGFVQALQVYESHPEEVLTYVHEFPFHQKLYCESVDDLNNILVEFEADRPECLLKFTF